MLKYKNIHSRVQGEFKRKINALDRKRLDGKNLNFFVGGTLEPQDRTNPIEQHLYRSCFAKVNVAVPDLKNSTKSTIVQKPLSISSYMQRSENDNTFKIKQINKPVSFQQGSEERSRQANGTNRFRGHSGITKIAVAQKEYYTYEYTISWVCPDPVFFEETFEPSFLKLGAYCSIEFGWGINDSGIVVPDLTIEQMEKYLDPEDELNTIQQRNLESAGNYYCNVGTVVNYDWKITEDGSYTGDIKVLSMGASPLLDTNQRVNNAADEIPAYKLQNTVLLNKEAQNIKKDRRSAVNPEELEKIERENIKELRTLLDGTISFKNAMVNLEDVLKNYLGLDENTAKTSGRRYVIENAAVVGKNNYGDNPYGLPDDTKVNPDKKIADSNARTKFKDGALFIDTIYSGAQSAVPEKLKNRFFMSWGFFEDIILNSFFEMKSGDKTIQQIRSVGTFITNSDAEFEDTDGFETFTDSEAEVQKPQSTRCKNTEFLYSMGLDSVILPGSSHPLLNQGFTKFDDTELNIARSLFKPEQRQNFSRVHLMHKIIDEYYKPFAKSKDSKYGEIRNMVFPIQMFKRHFENTPSVRQGLRNFWAEVSGHYGGFWNFKIGQDADEPIRIGISDAHYSEVPNVSEPKNQTQEEDVMGITTTGKSLYAGTALKNLDINPNKVFTFPVFGKNSIVKSFDVNLDLTAEAATIARYGTFTNPEKVFSSTNPLKNLGIECWSILNSRKREETEENAPNLERFKRLQKLANDTFKDLSYASDDGQGKGYAEEYQKGSRALMSINDEGIKWEDIDLIKEDNAKKRERIDNQLTKFYKGIGGIYDRDGNMSQYMKSTMNYLLTYNLDKGTGSLLQTVQAPIPVTISMELDGIGGLQVGNIFRVDYLPETYREFCYFVITKIDHNISKSGWSTSVDGMMMADMPHYWKVHKNQLNEYQQDYDELFKLTTVKLTDFGDGNFPEFDKLVEKFDKEKEQFEQLINLYNGAVTEITDAKAAGTFWENLFKRRDAEVTGQDQKKIKKSFKSGDYKSKEIALQYINQAYRELYNAHQEMEKLFSGVELFDKQIQEYTDIMNNKINPEYKLIQEDVEKEKAERDRKAEIRHKASIGGSSKQKYLSPSNEGAKT